MLIIFLLGSFPEFSVWFYVVNLTDFMLAFHHALYI